MSGSKNVPDLSHLGELRYPFFVIHYIQPLIFVALSVWKEHHSMAVREHSGVCVCLWGPCGALL